MSPYICLLLVVVSLQLGSAAILSDYVNVCSAEDPKINDCVKNSVQKIWPRMIKGIKDLGIFPMEPLIVPLIQIQQGNPGSGGISINLTNTRHNGWKETFFKNIKVDPRKMQFEFETHFPKYVILGNYKVSGRVLVVPITGSGATNITIRDAVTKVVLTGRLEDRGGKKYMTPTNLSTTIMSVGTSYLRMENLFGNKELSDSMNVFLNENSKEVIDEFKPAFEEVTNHLYGAILESFFRKVPYDTLFKDM